jgi:tripartite-type tricarboxylate transporter receptor subunit TctC
LPNYSATGYVGIMATGGTPRPVVDKLNAAINDVVRDGEFAKTFAAFGYEMVGGTVDEFTRFLKDDIERYRKLTQAAGIIPE